MMSERLEVSYGVSLNTPTSKEDRLLLARWHIKQDRGRILFYLPSLWENATNHGFPQIPDLNEDRFVDELILTELIERICLERAHEKIKVKGRKRCKPGCMVRRAASMMHDPDRWVMVRSRIPVNVTEV